MLAAYHLLASSVELRLPATQHNLPQLKQVTLVTKSLLRADDGLDLHSQMFTDLYFCWLGKTMLLGSHQ